MSDFIKDNFTILFIGILGVLSIILILVLTRGVNTKYKIDVLKWVGILVAWRVVIPLILLPGDGIKRLKCPITYNHIKNECPSKSSRSSSGDSNITSNDSIVGFIIAFLPLIGYAIFKIASSKTHGSLEKTLDSLEKTMINESEKKIKDNI